jgi:hypothetical protein
MNQSARILLLCVTALLITVITHAQCSICTKTASQMGEDAGRGLNGAIIYLAAAPFLIVSYIGYRWWKNNS